MPKAAFFQTQDARSPSIGRMHFGVSEQRPIRGLHYRWRQKQESKYDMHYGLELGIILAGKMRRHYADGQFDLTQGQVWLCGMWEPHGWKITQEPCEAIVLIISPLLLNRSCLAYSDLPNWLDFFGSSPLVRPQVPARSRKRMQALGKSIKQIIVENMDNLQAWLHLRLMEVLLSLEESDQASRAKPFAPNRDLETVNKAVRMVFQSRQIIQTQQAAIACGMNRNSFSLLFREVMGIQFSEFGLRCRLNGAADQIRTTDAPMKAIAREWGFSDTSHLHRCIREIYGCSPTDYRARSQGEQAKTSKRLDLLPDSHPTWISFRGADQPQYRRYW